MMVMNNYIINNFLLTVSIIAVPVFSFEEIICPLSNPFPVNLLNTHKVSIFEGNLSVRFVREKFKVYTYKKSKDVNYIVHETNVSFQGKMLVDNMFDKIKAINQTFHTRILGASILEQISCYDTILTRCQIFLPRNKTDSPRFFYQVENEILRLAAGCLEIKLTDKIGSLLPADFSKSRDFYDFGPLSVHPIQEDAHLYINHSITEESYKLESMQSALNTIIDAAVIEVKNELVKRNLGKIQIPDVFEPYHVFSDTIIQMSGYFNATDGYFEDISSVKRTSEVVLDQKEQKLSIAFGFGLETAQIHFNYYKAKYGILSMSGNISAAVEKVEANVKLVMDFQKEVCETKLDYFRFTLFDDLKIDIAGNKVLSPLASKIVTSVINKWRTEIAEFVETVIGQLVATELRKHNCEVYRPALNRQC